MREKVGWQWCAKCGKSLVDVDGVHQIAGAVYMCGGADAGPDFMNQNRDTSNDDPETWVCKDCDKIPGPITLLG
jgi:hypothetical protein